MQRCGDPQLRRHTPGIGRSGLLIKGERRGRLAAPPGDLRQMDQRAGVVRRVLDDAPQPRFCLVEAAEVAERSGYPKLRRHASGIGPGGPLIKGERDGRFAALAGDLRQIGQRAGVVRRTLNHAPQPEFRLVVAAKRAQRASNLHRQR